MNRLPNLLPLTHIRVGLDITSKKRAFEEAGLLFEELHGLSRANVADSLLARERLGSTGLGHGVAIPHGRIKGLKTPMLAVFLLQTPIGFDSPDELPVKLMFFLLVPEASTQRHLEILSNIASLLSQSEIREELLLSEDPQQLHSKIVQGSLSLPS
ncbi:MAG: PTS sugar transporter subunit IIA [Betaproteobacteria bacterium]|jgi:PTS system nitrogen regulatory IIA component